MQQLTKAQDFIVTLWQKPRAQEIVASRVYGYMQYRLQGMWTMWTMGLSVSSLWQWLAYYLWQAELSLRNGDFVACKYMRLKH